LSVHSLPPALARAQITLFWRKGVLSPKVRALIDILTAHSDMPKAAHAGRKNGSGRSNGQGPLARVAAAARSGQMKSAPAATSAKTGGTG
jgi:hypothetical protein